MVQQWRQPIQQHKQHQQQQQQQPEQFTCVGSRCHIFPSKSHPDLDLAWTSAEMRAEEATCSLNEAIQLVEEDSYSFAPRILQSSLPKKKLIVRKLLDKLLSASSKMHQFQTQFLDLKETVKNMQTKLRATEGAHMEVLRQMETLSSNLEGVRELHEEDSKDRIIHQIQMAKKNGVHSLELKEDEVGSTGTETENLRLENAKLKQDIEGLMKENEAKAAAADLAERNIACALEQVEKHKEVIARTTADNMVFLMKLKQTEEHLQLAKAKQEELQKQLEFYRSGWFEEASAEIEDAVKGSLDKAEACELELHTIRKQQEQRMREWEQKLQLVTGSLHEVSAMKRSLEERLKSLEEESTRLSHRLEKEVTERQQVDVETRVLSNTIEKTNRELTRLKSQYARVVEEMKEKAEDLNGRDEKEQQLIASLNSITCQLDTQRAMNSALMRKKEEVEWLCLEAQAEREKLKQQLRGLVNGQA